MTTDKDGGSEDASAQNNEPQQTEHEKRAFAARDTAKKERDDARTRADKAEAELKTERDKTAATEKAKAEADGDLKTQLELAEKKAADHETAAAEANAKLESANRKGTERDFIEKLAAKFPDSPKKMVRALYLGAIEDGDLERHSEADDALDKAEEAIKSDLSTEGKPNSKGNASGGAPVPAGFRDGKSNANKPKTLVDTLAAVQEERGRKVFI